MTREKAIEVVKEAMPTLWKETKDAIQTLIPELAESEDERIRKEIRNFLIDMECKGEWITYLEKQKEQKSTHYIPKFKVGDKVISTRNKHLTYDILEVGLINELGNPDYRVEIFVDGKPGITALKKEHNIHLIDCQKMDSWAKLIEQKPVEQIEDNEEESIGTTLINALNGNARLEWELKRAGVNVQKLITYLKQKPAEWSEEDSAKIGTLSSIIFDYAFYKDALDENNDLTGEYAELEDWLESLPERFNLQPKVKWNEEDNRILYNVISYIGFAAGQRGVKNDLFKEANDWLKSLSERFNPQPKQEWNEEDERMLSRCVKSIESSKQFADSNTFKEAKDKEKEWLKSLPERFNLQPKQEWSEEDKYVIDKVIEWAKIVNPTSSIFEKMPKERFIERLKSLRPQSHWKPSEQEKGALRTAIHILTDERSFPKAAAHLQNILDAFESEEPRKE